MGRLEGGMVVAEGLAHGTGTLEGAILRIDYQQIKEHPGKPACEKPLALPDEGSGSRPYLTHRVAADTDDRLDLSG